MVKWKWPEVNILLQAYNMARIEKSIVAVKASENRLRKAATYGTPLRWNCVVTCERSRKPACVGNMKLSLLCFNCTDSYQCEQYVDWLLHCKLTCHAIRKVVSQSVEGEHCAYGTSLCIWIAAELSLIHIKLYVFVSSQQRNDVWGENS
jgi:hypothetical protein